MRPGARPLQGNGERHAGKFDHRVIARGSGRADLEAPFTDVLHQDQTADRSAIDLKLEHGHQRRLLARERSNFEGAVDRFGPRRTALYGPDCSAHDLFCRIDLVISRGEDGDERAADPGTATDVHAGCLKQSDVVALIRPGEFAHHATGAMQHRGHVAVGDVREKSGPSRSGDDLVGVRASLGLAGRLGLRMDGQGQQAKADRSRKQMTEHGGTLRGTGG